MHTPSDRSVATRDRALPGLATVLDAAAAAALVARLLPSVPAGTPLVTYTRYKPGSSCLVALRYDGGTTPDFITLKAVATDADDKWAKYRGSDRVVVDESLRIAIRRFPNDGELRGLRWLFDDERREDVRATLGLPAGAHFDVITYKPERRLVVRVTQQGAPIAVIKCHDKVGFAHALDAQHALARLPHLPVSPATAWNEKRGVIVAPWMPGRIVDIATDPLDCFVAAGAALAAVHDSPMDVRAGATDSDVNVTLHRIAQSVSGWSPATREPLRLIVARLAQHRDEPAPIAVASHGDFYTKQILVGDDGISLLDFDECAIADPHIDLANFTAHIERDVLRRSYSRERGAAVVEALLQGYRRARAVDARRLTWRTAEALVRLTPHPFRHRDPEWPALTERLVQRAQLLLDGIPRITPSRPPMRVTPARSRAVRAWSRLAADDTLSFAASLASPDVMTRVLAQRLFSSELEAIEVQDTTLIRHKPGRRCMVAIDVGSRGLPQRWLGKVRARGLDARSATIHRMLWDSGARDFIPEPLGVVDGMRMTLQRAVEGVSLDQTLAHGGDPVAQAQLVARTLASFHALRLDPGRTWTLVDELTVLRTRFAAMRQAHPALHAQVTATLETLLVVAEPLATRATTSVVHRDLYHDQILIHGDQCTLVDLDLVSLGDPALDAGNLVGHLVELQWRGAIEASAAEAFCIAFCTDVVARSGGTITEESITRYAMLTLGRMVEIASRHVERASFVPAHLARLRQCLDHAGVHPELAHILEVSACQPS